MLHFSEKEIKEKVISFKDLCPSWKIKTVRELKQFFPESFAEERYESLKKVHWNVASPSLHFTPFLFSFTGGNAGLSSK